MERNLTSMDHLTQALTALNTLALSRGVGSHLRILSLCLRNDPSSAPDIVVAYFAVQEARAVADDMFHQRNMAGYVQAREVFEIALNAFDEIAKRVLGDKAGG